MASRDRKKWQYLVGRFVRRNDELWFESSAVARMRIRGGIKGFAEVLNELGAEGWDLVHCDDTAPRPIAGSGDDVTVAWGDMIFKRPSET